MTKTKVRDLAPLANLTNLSSLNLEGTKITNLAPLSRLAKLSDLNLGYTQVTKEEIDKLKQVLPNVKILR